MKDTISGETIMYQYDALKRLTSASSTPISGNTPAAWTQTYQYDGFGNLTAKVLNGTTNQLTNAIYDLSGNMTSGYGASFTYDGANRIASATTTSGGKEYFGYSADNKKIYRNLNGASEEWTFYGAMGEKLGTFVGPWFGCVDPCGTQFSFTPETTSVWFAGRLIQDANGVVIPDRLGTNRVGGARFYPYGDEITNTANDREKFATYTRDSYTGLDYADQRYYASTYGRFNTADPARSSAGASDPGSWNRYSYTRGDPVNRFDPGGTCDTSGDTSTSVTVCDTAYDLPPVISFGQDPSWNGTVGYFNTIQIQNEIGAALQAANALATQLFPPLSGPQRSTYQNAVTLAEQDIANAGPNCENALGKQGVASLTSVIYNPQVLNSVFDGQSSSYPQAGSTVAQFFANNKTTVGAEVFTIPGQPSQNVEFLGSAFFDPSLAGVPNGNYAQAQAFMALHEAVHLVTGLPDAAFGGSKQLTNLLVQNCFPVLGLPGALGGLTAP